MRAVKSVKISEQLILVIDTSSPEARLGIFSEGKLLGKVEWEAGRALAETIYDKLEGLLSKNSFKYEDLRGIIVVLGPGSFTGLRIGVVITNAFSYALNIPTSGVQQMEKKTLEEIFYEGQKEMKNDQVLLPFYNREPNITIKKK